MIPKTTKTPQKADCPSAPCSRSFADLLESLDAWIDDALKSSKPIGLTLSRARVTITDQHDRIGELLDALERQNKAVEKMRAVLSGIAKANPTGWEIPTCSRSSDTPETDLNAWYHCANLSAARAERDITGYHVRVQFARNLERQRNIAVAALRELAARYGHKSAPGCECDDCAHIRPIEEAIAAATSPANDKILP